MKLSTDKRQNGFTLIMSMIILIILTMLGLSSIQGTQTEIAMAGNMRNADIAFQSAEIGLISAETTIEGTISKNTFNDTLGLYAEHTPDPDYFNDDSWGDKNSKESTATLTNVSTNPRYIIKYLGDRSQNEPAKVNIGGYGTQPPGLTVSYLRTTSRGFGQSDRSVRMLQSYYGKAF
jgi:type IV pilus assembly protein PilX